MNQPDFSGYATKNDLKCSDGRTIKADAFKHMDGMKVPLVWQHQHSGPENILGHALLENRADGVYTYGFFNNTEKGQTAKAMVEHGDIEALSIYANKLTERQKNVYHGDIKEVSLVIAGANPGATIDNVYIRHEDSDEVSVVEGEATIYTGLTLEHEDLPEKTDEEPVVHAGATDAPPEGTATVQEVFDTLSQTQKDVVYYMIEEALNGNANSSQQQDPNAAHSDDQQDDNTIQHDQEGKDMSGTAHNVFEKQGEQATGTERHALSHSDLLSIFEEGKRLGSMKQAVESYALAHGIDNIEILFPDAKTLTNTPEFNKRRTEWVAGVLSGTKHSPFSRVKSIIADITFEEARARGYIKGNFKKEEFFSLSKRTTGPTTVYKKQKLDRDDVVDITDFDVMAWLKQEIRLMLEEEIARAILIGDGRDISDEDKIKDPAGQTDGLGIRSILHEHELYATTVNVNLDLSSNASKIAVVDSIIDAMQYYKGTGSPTFYTTLGLVTKLLLTRDTLGRRIWKTKADLAAEMLVSDIVEVEVMESETDLLGIVVNLSDYNVGADKGGEINFFDDFDIDYNQLKTLMETRISGALVKIKSALVIKKVASSDVALADPTDPTFVESTGVVTIPTMAHVVYTNADTLAVLAAGAQPALAAGATLNVQATADAGYYFPSNANDQWTFSRPAA